MKPLVPTRGTGKPFGFLIAMSGVPRVVLLVGGRRPLFPLSVSRIAISFLPPRAFDVFAPMYTMEHPLEHYCDFVYRMIYVPPCLTWGEQSHPAGEEGDDRRLLAGWDDDDDRSVEYAVTIIQAIGIGTEEQRVHLRSIFCAPIDDSLEDRLYGTAERAETIVNRALWRLEGHLRVPLVERWGAEVPDDVGRDFAELRHVLDMNGPLYEVCASHDEMRSEEQREWDLAYEIERRASHGNPYYYND